MKHKSDEMVYFNKNRFYFAMYSFLSMAWLFLSLDNRTIFSAIIFLIFMLLASLYYAMGGKK